MLRVEASEKGNNIKYEEKMRIFSDAKLQHYKYELQNTNWDEIYSCVDPNIAYGKFNDIISNFLNIIFPVKSMKRKNKPKAWITQGIKNSCKTKRTLYSQLLKGEISKDKYNTYKNILKKVILEAKKLSNLLHNFLKK